MYCDEQTYYQLYARFQKRPIEELLYYAGDLHDKRVADLCCGNGRLALEALSRGAIVTAVDKSAEMVESLQQLKWNGTDIEINYCSMSQWFSFLFEKYDVLFCQQAINYWLLDVPAKTIAAFLKKDGLFVFNTFNKDPGTKPLIKTYDQDGHSFVETTWRVDSAIYHFQCRDGLEPHVTKFTWLPSDQILAFLDPYFETEEHVDGPTSIWVCRRR